MENAIVRITWGPECCGHAMHDEGHPGSWECVKCHRTLIKDVDTYHATVPKPTTFSRAWAVPTRNRHGRLDGLHEKILGIVDDAEVTLRGRTAAGRDLVKPSGWCGDCILAVVEIER